MKVFCYGTLRKGQGNHSLLKEAEYLRDDVILGYQMYDLGWFPGIIRGNGIVHGEVYEVDEGTLEALHSLEGYYPEDPESSMYIPETVNVGDMEFITYVFNRQIGDSRLIESGDWVEYVQEQINET